MTPATAKTHLQRMLRHVTAGSILHRLAEALTKPEPRDDAARIEQRRAVEQTLFVLGVGVDAALPHR